MHADGSETLRLIGAGTSNVGRGRSKGRVIAFGEFGSADPRSHCTWPDATVSHLSHVLIIPNYAIGP